MAELKTEYKNIFKSTFLFGFVQIFNILTKVGLNKAAAVFLGAEGVGLIGIYQSLIEMLKTFFGLGVSQSAVRDISKANTDGDEKKFSMIITVTNKVVWFTAILGAIATAILSPYLSQWSFGNDKYTFVFIIVAVIVLLSILAEGQLSILKGMRQLRALAKASIYGSASGLIAGVPFYYFLGKDGIVPTLFVVALTAVIFSTYYVRKIKYRKIKYRKIKVSAKETIDESSNMVKMGMALMFVTFLGILSDYIIKIYISNISNLDMVGIYQAGATIVSGYFGIIIVAMMTDYYPRISAVYDNNIQLSEEVDKQSKVGLILIGPLIVVFMFLMPHFITILYSEDFLISVDFVSYAIFGTIIIICSNPMDMILLAKQKAKVFLLATVFYRIIGIFISLFSYKYYGMQGLGISVIIMALIHILLMQGIMYKLYNIRFKLETMYMLLITLLITYFAFLVKDLESLNLRYSTGIFLFLVSIVYSVYNLEKKMEINVIEFIKLRIKKLGNKHVK